MKRKIYILILLLALTFTAGCNKQEESPVPTPTTAATPTPTPSPSPTPSPTPVPENLAKTNLEKLPELFDHMMSYRVNNNIDYSTGMGYDVTLKFSLGKQVAELLELTDLKDISATGTMDVKDYIAANISLNLNDSEVINSHLFADSTNLLFNLPKYSSNYAATTWEQLAALVNEKNIEDKTGQGSSLTGSSYEIIRTIGTVDQPNQLSDEDLLNSLRNYLQDFVECFIEADGITKNVSIGTGDYFLSGEKHTVIADINDIYAILGSLEAELQNYYEDVDFDIEDLKVEGATSLLIDYYISENGDYAWAAYPDNQAQEQLVYISTALGFCLYRANEDGTTEVAMCSVNSSENAGVITLLFGEEEPIGVIDFEHNDNSFTIFADLNTMELTMESSKVNDTIRYNATIVVEGISFVVKETLTPTHTDISCSIASYGMEYLTMSMTTDIRDYVEIPIPQNTVTLDDWTAELDQDTLAADMQQLMQDYPFLMELFGISDEEPEEDSEDNSWNQNFWDDDSDENQEESTPPEDYTNDFMDMTGYNVDENGNVYFEPLEEEILAKGKPSTAYTLLPLSDSLRQQLMDYGTTAFPDVYHQIYQLYSVQGNVENKDVASYYNKQYTYFDNSNYNNSYSVCLDLISEDLIALVIYHESEAEALRITNEVIKILGADYSVTMEEILNNSIVENLWFVSYVDETGYHITIYPY